MCHTFHRTLVALAVCTIPTVAMAGMPSVTLTELGRLRLHSISFFVFGFLVATCGVKMVWNLLQKDFPRLPRMTFKTAAGVVFLWGMLFILVLTMISGARELMTPGAWEKQDLTYKIKSAARTPEAPETVSTNMARREQQLERLRTALLLFAARHEGRFPLAEEVTAIDDDLWLVPDRSGMRYLYLPGATVDSPSAVLAYEPAVYDDRQLVLTADGKIQPMDSAAMRRTLSVEGAP
ncbi:MAG: hypothetical protein ACKV0T_10170 [Planctomycetales bacterium]